MIRQKFTVGLIASAFTLSLAPAWAGQRSAPDSQSGSRPSNGDTVGSAVPRDSGGGGSASSGSGASSPSAGASSGSSSSNSGAGWMGSSSPAPETARAPRSERAEQGRRGGGSNGGTTTGRAVPRGSSGSGGSTSSTAGSNNGGNRGDGRSREGVPTYSRPRDGRQPVGSAVERRGPPPTRGGGVYYPGIIYDPYYSSFYNPYYGGRYSSYWSPYGYGFGLGYFAYDPFLFGGGYGGAYGPGYGGYGYNPYEGGYSSSGSGYRGVGSVRLKVKPTDAQVYVDGYYVGVIDSYDGVFQRLGIDEGGHKVEVRAEGYEPVQFDVMIIPGETVTYKGELKPIH
jgi:hypothetical protein